MNINSNWTFKKYGQSAEQIRKANKFRVEAETLKISNNLFSNQTFVAGLFARNKVSCVLDICVSSVIWCNNNARPSTFKASMGKKFTTFVIGCYIYCCFTHVI